ncbi:MAG: DUF559 domain-containing protein [Flavobacteriales bacterium]|nr:DUF559 domain-containing protein [Flavobacteriales bacterium]MBL0045452.1 DUF559 domain-containing protein [Flavobacteriales bacterium]
MDLKRNRKDLKEVRRSLRSNATSSEAVLWSSLSGSKLDGRKFRRQYGIGPLVLDFYCPSERLCVELDGSVHHDPTVSMNDQWRDEQLKALGIRTVRIENVELLANLDGVLDLIRKHFR